MLNTTKTPNNSTEYSNSVIELHILGNENPLKNKPTSQLEENSHFFFLNHKIIKFTKVNKVLTITDDNFFNISCSLPFNEKAVQFLAHFPSSYVFTQNKIQYSVYFQVIVIIMTLTIKKASNKLLADILYTYLNNEYPRLSQKSHQALLQMLYFYKSAKVVHTSNCELERLFSCGRRRVQQITQELAKYGIIQKDQSCCNDDNSLHITINLPTISGIKFKKTKFLATYVKTEVVHIKDTTFKVAIFKDIHDLENVITIKTDRIPYDDETSYFLKQLNAGDVISYTPSVTRPTIKGIKYPLNLELYSKAKTDDNITFKAKFDDIQEVTHGRGYTMRTVRFKDIYGIDEDISFNHTWHDPRPEEVVLLQNLESGDFVYFEAEVKLGKQGKQWLDNITNIREA